MLKSLNSDIRGVAIDGVEGESVSLTEPVTEAIAAAFASWLLEKKKADGSRCLRVSIGHDSRISAQKLQVILILFYLCHHYDQSSEVSASYISPTFLLCAV